MGWLLKGSGKPRDPRRLPEDTACAVRRKTPRCSRFGRREGKAPPQAATLEQRVGSAGASPSQSHQTPVPRRHATPKTLAAESHLLARSTVPDDIAAVPPRNLIILAIALVAIAVLFTVHRVRRARFRQRRKLRSFDPCDRCGFDLRATTGPCPECGRKRPEPRREDKPLEPPPEEPRQLPIEQARERVQESREEPRPERKLPAPAPDDLFDDFVDEQFYPS